jgi:hypothetical protein
MHTRTKVGQADNLRTRRLHCNLLENSRENSGDSENDPNVCGMCVCPINYASDLRVTKLP